VKGFCANLRAAVLPDSVDHRIIEVVVPIGVVPSSQGHLEFRVNVPEVLEVDGVLRIVQPIVAAGRNIRPAVAVSTGLKRAMEGMGRFSASSLRSVLWYIPCGYSL